jgi:ParB family chromosome partitioning protein
VERGYVRPEDEPAPEPEPEAVAAEAVASDVVTHADPGAADAVPVEEEDEGERPLSDRLISDLTAHRTLALRDALARDPEVALVAALHAMALRHFYRYALDSCVEIEPRSAVFGAQAPGLGDMPYARAVKARHEAWAQRLPKAPEALWEVLAGCDADSRAALYAHCVALTINAVHDPYHRRPRALAHGEVLASTLGVDMARAGWAVTAANYLGRVTKARILDAVREAKGSETADRIAGLKKPEMVTAAEELLAGSGWLPELLRTKAVAADEVPEIEVVDADDPPVEASTGDGVAQSAPDRGETAMGDPADTSEDEPVTDAEIVRTAAE